MNVRMLFDSNVISNWQGNDIRNAIGGLLHYCYMYCVGMRVPIYRFPGLCTLPSELISFFNIINSSVNDEDFCSWVIEEVFRKEPTLLDKILELDVQYPEYLTNFFLMIISDYRRKILNGRTNDHAYVLEIDIVGSGDLTGEPEALLGKANMDKYVNGLHIITGIFGLFKLAIKDANGRVFCEEGDAILAAFGDIKNTVSAAYTLQTELRLLREEDEEKGLRYRMGIGKGTICVMKGRSRYSFSIVEAKRISSKIQETGILISHSCFCDLINCKQQQSNRDNCDKSRCSIISDPKTKWPMKVMIRQAGVSVKIMPRGPVGLKHTTGQAFEILTGNAPEVIL